MSGLTELSIIIPVVEPGPRLLACVESIRDAGVPVSTEIVVVDNGSGRASDLGPTVRVLGLDRNTGFAHACNEGARSSAGKVILILNDDVTVEPGAVAAALETLSLYGGTAVIGGEMLDARGATHPLNRCAIMSLRDLLRLAFKVPLPKGRATREEMVSGCFLLTSRRVWERLRGFDERYFFYFEDMDLCVRARAAGIAVTNCPAARYRHAGGLMPVRNADKVRWYRASGCVYLRTHWHAPAAVLGTVLLTLFAARRLAAFGCLRVVDAIKPRAGSPDIGR